MDTFLAEFGEVGPDSYGGALDRVTVETNGMNVSVTYGAAVEERWARMAALAERDD